MELKHLLSFFFYVRDLQDAENWTVTLVNQQRNVWRTANNKQDTNVKVGKLYLSVFFTSEAKRPRKDRPANQKWIANQRIFKDIIFGLVLL